MTFIIHVPLYCIYFQYKTRTMDCTFNGSIGKQNMGSAEMTNFISSNHLRHNHPLG